MKGLNKVLLIGNLGKDPEVQTLEGNIKVAKFSLATTESYKDDKGPTHSQTEWHSIVLWRGLAEIGRKAPEKRKFDSLGGEEPHPLLRRQARGETICDRSSRRRADTFG
jgi:Single-strand binding protein family